jgi:HTH-type transcriptional regulator/antitoxin HipB
MRDITIQTAEQLGSAIRLKRLERGISQVDLAQRLGVERKWIIKLEAGNPKAELGLVLKALAELDFLSRLTSPLEPSEESTGRASSKEKASRLDEVFERLDRRRR